MLAKYKYSGSFYQTGGLDVNGVLLGFFFGLVIAIIWWMIVRT